MLEHVNELGDLTDRRLLAIFLDLLLALQLLLILEVLKSLIDPCKDRGEFVMEVVLFFLQRVPLLDQRICLGQRWQYFGESQWIFLEL